MIDQENIIYAKGEASFIKLEANKMVHYIPVSVNNNENIFKKHFKVGVKNTVELHDGFIVIRPKTKKDLKINE